MFSKLFWIGIAGAAGALSRYGLAGFFQKVLKLSSFPIGTFIVNIVGCFIFGILWTVSLRHSSIDPKTRTALLVGFTGSFTTFSTFIFENGELFRASQWMALTGNLVGQIVLGALALVAGIALGKLV